MIYTVKAFRLITACALGASMMVTANADTTFQVSETGLGLGMSTKGLTLPIGTGGSTTANFWAGFQTISVANGSTTNSFQAFCIDPFQWSSGTPSTYTQTSLSPTFDAAHIANITKLFNYGYATATSNLNAAAMQLALWEVANDNGNLSTGLVRKTANTDAGLVTQTNSLLNNYAAYAGPSLYNFTFYKSSAQQDFVTVTAVPEPATYGMMLLGLGMIGTIARRRKNNNS
jgi:hypothetical protein